MGPSGIGWNPIVRGTSFSMDKHGSNAQSYMRQEKEDEKETEKEDEVVLSSSLSIKEDVFGELKSKSIKALILESMKNIVFGFLSQFGFKLKKS